VRILPTNIDQVESVHDKQNSQKSRQHPAPPP